MDHLGRVLIVEADPVAARVVLRECTRMRRATVIDSAGAAMQLLGSKPRLTALIAEQTLPDGVGLAVVKAYRSVYPLMPVLVLTADTSPQVINRAHALRAEFVAKPARRRNLGAFLRRAVAFERVPDRRVAFVIDEIVRRCSLSPRETDLLAAAVHGVPRRTIADQIGTTENTIKSCIKGLLRKCDGASLDVVVRSIWMEALAGSDARRDDDPDRDSAPPPAGASTIPPPTAENIERSTR
jgi:two-component system response regulator DesR